MNNVAQGEKGGAISVRQLCFFFCFLMPVSKLMEVPATLARYAEGDLLFPALLHFLLQGGMVTLFLFFAKKWDRSLFEIIEEKTNETFARVFYFLLAAFYLFFTLLPLLDLERFVYADFFDTTPSLSAFVPFFFLSAYIGAKSLRAFGRCCDLSMPLFLVAFLGLTVMAVGAADFSNVLPFFGTPVSRSMKGFFRTFVHFSDTALLLPLLGEYRYQKGDGKKVALAYGGGTVFVLFFLAVFYGIFSSIAPRQSYAFNKVGQYFPALSVVGRVDLLLVYLMTVLLLFYYSFPIQLSVHCLSRATACENKVLLSSIVNVLLLLFTLIFERYYFEIKETVSRRLCFLFPLFAYGAYAVLLFFLPKKKAKENRLCATENR